MSIAKPQRDSKTLRSATLSIQPAMSTTAAARSVFRTTIARAAPATRFTSGAKPKAARKPAFCSFRTTNQKPVSLRVSRSPVELSCCVETMLPYHTATSSALLTSLLSASRCSYSWAPEDCNDDV